MSVLIIEDDVDLALSLEDGVSPHFPVLKAFSLSEAEKVLIAEPISVVICDYNLGENQGIAILEIMARLEIEPVVIMITAFGTKDLVIEALNKGVFRFLEKPFSCESLIECIQAARSEYQLKAKQKKSGLESVRIDPLNSEVIVDDESVNLTSTEYKIFSLLFGQESVWVSKDQIQNWVWGEGKHLSRNVLDTHISNLKKKSPTIASMIISERNKGYKFVYDYKFR